MLDLLVVGITVAFFGLNVSFAYGCDQLMGSRR
jgi:hypothetical protein